VLIVLSTAGVSKRLDARLATAVRAAPERDGEAASAPIWQDRAVDTRKRDLEQLVVRLFALRQPVAVDLRDIVAGLNMPSALERIRDCSADIAGQSPPKVQHRLPSGLASAARLVEENLL
jgi:phosphate transport system protein